MVSVHLHARRVKVRVEAQLREEGGAKGDRSLVPPHPRVPRGSARQWGDVPIGRLRADRHSA
ncbi:MAG: hypothetical protein DWI56_00945 [Candidatus Limnocylindrus sp.]|nr:MAG: hypothetical protein DWI56_00945 [Candidatus Limnocylindrus sp.]